MLPDINETTRQNKLQKQQKLYSRLIKIYLKKLLKKSEYISWNLNLKKSTCTRLKADVTFPKWEFETIQEKTRIKKAESTISCQQQTLVSLT